MEELSVPLSDESHGKHAAHLNADDETVSSAPPRLEVDVDLTARQELASDPVDGESIDRAAAAADEKAVADSERLNVNSSSADKPQPRASPLSTPTSLGHNTMSASTKKFVHFLSDADSTPIISHSKQFAEDDDATTNNKIRQPSIDEGNDQDEKKEESPSPTVSTSAMREPALLSTPLEVVSNREEAPSSSAATPNTSHSPSRISYVSPPGRRSISLRLLEEVEGNDTAASDASSSSLTPFKRLNLRRFRSLSLSTVMVPLGENKIDMTDRSNNTNNNNSHSSGGSNNNTSDEKSSKFIDRGIISVSWYEGTTSSEMTEHVFNCVLRKLRSGSGNGEKKRLEDVRLLDENVVPHEEVVLCPFLPDGSHFILKFKTVAKSPPKLLLPQRDYRIPPYISQPPDSPSAEPTPYPSSANSNGVATTNAVNAQLQLLNAATALLQSNGIKTQGVLGQNGFSSINTNKRNVYQDNHSLGSSNILPKLPVLPNVETVPKDFTELNEEKLLSTSPSNYSTENEKTSVSAMNSTDALIEQQLRQLNELFLLRNGQSAPGSTTAAATSATNTNEPDQENHHDPQLLSYYKSQEKKQVIFTIANYFVLFMSLIAISAEIQSRLPQWMDWVQDNYDSVQNCATDHDALFECISNGNFSGLVASFMLWATQSASAKRIFLFGFDTPKKLWTVVYEALVSAVCWGLSYIFIRRGLNPNTRERFIQKYWKDAVYGSLAGFNAAFLKAVLKNLVPQDVALQAIETRQLRIFNWLGMLMSDE